MKEMTLICLKACNQLILFYWNFLYENKYIWKIQFNGINEDRIKNLQFFWNTFNPKYTQFELAFRFVYLICSMIVTCIFTKSMQRFSILDWSLEQRWMILLLVFLVFYNDPFYSLTFLTNNSFPLMVDEILQSTFLCFLLLFWLSIYHGIRENVRGFVSFYLLKIILVSLIWVFAIGFSSVRIVQEFRDPMYNLTIDVTQLTTMRVIFYLIGIGYVLYLLFLIIRAFGELRNIPFFDIQLKFTTILMVCVVLISIIVTVFRFGSGIIEENLVPDLISPYKNSVECLLFYSLMNLYLYTMAYVYSPAQNAGIDSLFHNNPTFSMIDDSDDDVIYGSDYEASQLTSRK